MLMIHHVSPFLLMEFVLTPYCVFNMAIGEDVDKTIIYIFPDFLNFLKYSHMNI